MYGINGRPVSWLALWKIFRVVWLLEVKNHFSWWLETHGKECIYKECENKAAKGLHSHWPYSMLLPYSLAAEPWSLPASICPPHPTPLVACACPNQASFETLTPTVIHTHTLDFNLIKHQYHILVFISIEQILHTCMCVNGNCEHTLVSLIRISIKHYD